MAILFDKDLDYTRLLMAYNNNVIEFYSDSGIAPLKASIQIGILPPVIIYPQPNGKFFYNFKTLISSILNTDNFKDDTLPDFGTAFDYDWTKVFNADGILITIQLSDSSTESITLSPKWLAGYFQDFTKWDAHYVDGARLLHNQVNNVTYLKAWNGYPIDLPFYKPTGGDLAVVNNGTLTTVPFAYEIGRLFLSDGTTDWSNPVQTTPFKINIGLNDIVINDVIFLKLDVENPCYDTDYLTGSPKVYIKWLNNFGGWSYWLFDKADIVRNFKDLGELDNDFSNREDTISKTLQIGKTSTDRMNITTDTIDRKYQCLLESLLESESVFLYRGTPFSPYNFNQWLEVSVNTTSVAVQKAKRLQNRFDLTIELPQRENRTK